MHVFHVCMFVSKHNTTVLDAVLFSYPLTSITPIITLCLCLPQAVSRLFDTCSPLLAGCKKNRANWMHLAMEAQDENCENTSCVTLKTQLEE